MPPAGRTRGAYRVHITEFSEGVQVGQEVEPNDTLATAELDRARFPDDRRHRPA